VRPHLGPTRLTLLGIAVFLTLLLSFRLNVFLILPKAVFDTFQADSQSLVFVKLHEMSAGSNLHDGGFLRMEPNFFQRLTPAPDPASVKRYNSQFGLQGWCIGVLHRVSGGTPEATCALAEWMMSGIFTAILTGYVLLLATRHGAGAAGFAFVFVLFSVHLLPYARNLYWAAFTLILPAVLAHGLLPGAIYNRQKLWWFLGLFGAAVYLKCLCGYECITNITLSAAPVLLFHNLRVGMTWKPMVALQAKVFGIAIAAFFLALVTHFSALSAAIGGPGAAFQAIAERATQNTVNASSVIGDPIKDKYSKPGIGHAVLFAKYLSMEAVNIGIRPAFGDGDYYVARATQAALVLGSVILAALLYRRSFANTDGAQGDRAMAASLIFAFVCSCSWIVAARVHSIVHTHLVSIVFMFPFGLHLCAAVAWYIHPQRTPIGDTPVDFHAT
jgi:hypothetical protein